MKLDRNTNKDGRGKYAILNLRDDTIEWGGRCQFFVIKYSDLFAEAALLAYALAADAKAVEFEKSGHHQRAKDLREWADEILREAAIAKNWPVKKIPD